MAKPFHFPTEAAFQHAKLTGRCAACNFGRADRTSGLCGACAANPVTARRWCFQTRRCKKCARPFTSGLTACDECQVLLRRDRLRYRRIHEKKLQRLQEVALHAA